MSYPPVGNDSQTMRDIVIEILIIVLLVLANGVFAMAEIAIVSVRKARFHKLAEQGDRRARAALELTESPNRFLSTVQVGITLIGILAGAFGGATLARAITSGLRAFPAVEPYGEAIGIAAVVLGITLLSVVLGELVPKRIALNNPLGTALALARPMRRLSLLAGPVVHLLSSATDLMLRLFGFTPRAEPPVTEEEIRALLEQGQRAGVFFKTEKEIVERSLVLDTLRAGDLMTPRARIIWLDVADPDEVNWRKIVSSAHSYFPVYDGSRDHVVGIVSVKALWGNVVLDGRAGLKELVVQPLFVPVSMGALRLLESFKQSRKHVALVSDEFGTVQGLVTLVDVLEELVGDFPAYDEPPDAHVARREDGSWLVDAVLELEKLKGLLAVRQLPGEEDEQFQTLGGFVMAHLQRIPREGDHFTATGYRFEIADMDGLRVDKVLIQRVPSTAPSQPENPPPHHD
jgi:putative hemolysin